MNRLHRLCTALLLAVIPICALASSAPEPKRTLARFESEAELQEWLAKLRKQIESTRRARQKSAADMAVASSPAPAPPPAAALAMAPAKSEAAGKIAEESVTNVQTAGVDEGGIVKVHGEHLVVLRRGRLFTVSLAHGSLKPGSQADAFGPGIDPGGAWYDEMLIRGDTVIVIGFSYQRGGTEVGLFDIDRSGGLTHRATYHLRSNDYYSSRNYASRLIGDKLIFYAPLRINLFSDALASFPAVRKWSGKRTDDFKRIAPPTRIYRTDEAVEPHSLTMHSVTVCDLAQREMECEATGVLGPAGRVFYVSQGSVYVWINGQSSGPRSTVVRIPLEGGAPSALKASGGPVDQMSFLESDDGHLNVLLRGDGRGEAMWAAERGSGSVALLRVSLDLFGDGRDVAPASAYRRLPSPRGYNLQNRFVGSYLIYGSGSTWGAPNPNGPQAVHAVRWADKGTAQTLSIPHGVDRIEALGRHAMVIGSAGKDLHFSSLRLDAQASLPHRFTREDTAQGETRSHGFFYKAESEDVGLVGLPVVGGGRPGHKQLREGSAAVMFLRNEALMVSELGELIAKDGSRGDKCRASCVDWYGNARPLFLRNRLFALLGYEIVEGRLGGETIEEVRRVSFAPR